MAPFQSKCCVSLQISFHFEETGLRRRLNPTKDGDEGMREGAEIWRTSGLYWRLHQYGYGLTQALIRLVRVQFVLRSSSTPPQNCQKLHLLLSSLPSHCKSKTKIIDNSNSVSHEFRPSIEYQIKAFGL